MKHFPLIDETISHKYSAATLTICWVTMTGAGAYIAVALYNGTALYFAGSSQEAHLEAAKSALTPLSRAILLLR